MALKEYIVTLKKGEDPLGFFDEMTRGDIDPPETIPYRQVKSPNPRPHNKRNTHFLLHKGEVAKLLKDPRVEAIEIPPDQRDDIQIGRHLQQSYDFDKPSGVPATDSTRANWGLRRHVDYTNPYVGASASGIFPYNLDGKGVDIVIHDSGIQADHPEWEDENGVSRLQQIDWYAESGLPGTMPAGFYTDYEGHGTHCAGIAAGKTYGWAKNARIYALKVGGLEGPTDPNSGIPISECFDIVTAWHNNKPIDPATGYKRPTIVNMSWGYSTFYDSITSINYRGVNYPDATAGGAAYGLISLFNGASYYTNVRIASVDADIQQMIDAGIHITIAAGNNWHKIDVPAGSDYNNYANVLYLANPYVKYYHRGSSPFDDEAFIVGNVDLNLQVGGLERAKSSSERGPGVNIWATGSGIISATSNVNDYGSLPMTYPFDAGFKIVNISGTSMATPEVCGVCACILQLHPEYTPAQLRTYMENASQPVLYTTGLDNDYTNSESLMGSPNRMMFQNYNSSKDPKIFRS